MPKYPENLSRKIQQIFRVSDSELALIKEKMEAAGVSNKEMYFRKMVLDGYIVRLDFSDVREMVCLLRIATNLLNQIAKRCNSSGNLYAADVKDIQDSYELLWQQAEKILKQLTKM
jgi:hypothetical protein